MSDVRTWAEPGTARSTDAGRGGAPTQCVILAGGQGQDPDLLAMLLFHAKRFGFDRITVLRDGPGARCLDRQTIVVGAREVGGEDVAGAPATVRPPFDPVVLLLDAHSVFDCNWLALVPLLSGAPRAAAVVAVPLSAGAAIMAPSRGGVCIVRGEALATALEIADAPSWHAVLPALAARGELRSQQLAGPFLSRKGESGAGLSEALTGSLCRPAVFFDRDGVLNVDHGYVGHVERFEWLLGAIEGVKAANDRGAFAFLVTNQSGVARGYYEEAALVPLHAHMQRELRARGAHLDAIRYCPHLPDAPVEAFRATCACRKPEPGMILDLLAEWPVDRERSLLIGDKTSDVEAARRAGIEGRLYTGGDLATLVPDFAAAPRGEKTSAKVSP